MTTHAPRPMILWLALLLFLLPPVIANQKKEQAQPEPALPEAVLKMYRAADGKLYVPGVLPVKLHFSAGGDQQEAPAPAWTFTKEGKQLLSAGGQNGEPVEIYVDLTPPQTDMQFFRAPEQKDGGKSFYGKGVVFDVAPRDNLSGVFATYLSLNGSSFVLLRGSFSQFEPDQENIVRVLSIDNVGNREPVRTRWFFYDTTPPSSTYQVTGPTFTGPVLSPGCTISLAATDTAAGLQGIYYRLDDGPENKYSGPLPVNKMSPGKHSLSWFAVDKVENREEAQRFDFDYDNQPPVASLQVEGASYRLQDNVFVAADSRLKLQAQDNRAGIATIFYRLDAQKESPYNEPVLLPKESGLHQVEISAIDHVANQSEPVSHYFYLDMTPPESEFKIEGFYTRVNQEFIIHKEIFLHLDAADLEAGVHAIRYRVNQTEPLTYTKPITFDQDGLYQLEYWAEDNVGNVESPKTVSLRVDNAPAKAGFRKDLDSFPKQWYMHPDGRLIGSTDLPFYLHVGLMGKDGKTIGEPILMDLSQFGKDDGKPVTFTKGGVNTLKIITGLPGKLGIEAFQVLIDALPPQTAIAFSEAACLTEKKIPCYGPTLKISFSGVDEKQGIVSGYKETRVSVDDSDFFVYTKPLGIFSREKTYTVDYFSVDNVGNAEKARRVQFSVDGTPPLTAPQVGGESYGNILSAKSTITLTATDSLAGVKAIYYAFDSGKEQLYQTPLTGGILAALAEGKHTLRYFAVDRTGNRENPRAMSFLLDHGGPAVLFTVSGRQHPVGKTLYLAQDSRVQLSATDPRAVVKNIHYRIGSQTSQVYSTPFSIPPANQGIPIGYTAEDNVGNISPWLSQMVVVDTEAPQTQLKIEGPFYSDKFRSFAGPQTHMVLSAQDNLAGVKQILCSMDNGPFQAVTAPFQIQRGGAHSLRFHAVDQVNNSENITVKTITIDSTPPILTVLYNIRPRKTADGKKLLFPPTLMISFTASDKDTEVDKIVYRLNNEQEKLYRNPLSKFDMDRDITLTVYAYDRVGNRAVQTITFRVEKGE